MTIFKHTNQEFSWRSPMIRILSSIAALIITLAAPALADEEIFGPPNLLKTCPTPFNMAPASPDLAPPTEGADPGLPSLGSRSLSSRLLSPRLYLPGRMVIGRTAEFIIKGRPGYWAALAMADRNSGARPICGRQLHLGPDRKLVSLGQIPEGGVLSLFIDTPIQGDLIGECWYFEAAVWSLKDFSDMELAIPVPSDSETAGLVTLGLAPKNGAQKSPGSPRQINGVIVSAEPESKRGIRIVPEAAIPLQQVHGATSLDSGRP